MMLLTVSLAVIIVVQIVVWVGCCPCVLNDLGSGDTENAQLNNALISGCLVKTGIRLPKLNHFGFIQPKMEARQPSIGDLQSIWDLYNE